MNKSSLLTKALSLTVIGAVLTSPIKAKADWADVAKDAIGNWGNAIRSNTVGRIAGQEFIGSLSMADVDALKAKYGGDYHAKITDWCNAKVQDRTGFDHRNPSIVPGVSSTWRVENNQVNCYWRRFGSN
jgi:hypothetical protein